MTEVVHENDRRFFDRTETFGRSDPRRRLARVSRLLPGNRGKVGFFPESPAPSSRKRLRLFSEGRFTPSGAEVRASVKRESRTVAMSRNANPRQVELARGD